MRLCYQPQNYAAKMQYALGIVESIVCYIFTGKKIVRVAELTRYRKIFDKIVFVSLSFFLLEVC